MFLSLFSMEIVGAGSACSAPRRVAHLYHGHLDTYESWTRLCVIAGRNTEQAACCFERFTLVGRDLLGIQWFESWGG